MALPNVGSWDNSPNPGKKRLFGNESKGMDEVLGSNISKDYQKVGSLARDGRSLPNLIQNDPRLANMKVNLNNVPTTPTTKDRKLQRDSSREVMDAYRSAPVHQYSEQGDRMESMERTMKFLIEQINNFEKMLYNETRKSKSKYDAEKEQIEKLELNMKLYEDNYSLGNNELANKVGLLEARLLREEKAKIELREKLSFTELNQRELLEYVRALQSQENNELIQMRGMIQERMTEDQGSNIKEKERSKTLFHEVVRLGEQQEKVDEMVQNINLALEGKLKVLEAKMQVNERAVNTLNERGSAGLNNLSTWNDKVENRVKDLESNLYAITREQIKDKDIIAKLQGINSKLSEDLAHLLGNLNSDYNQKLDARVTELVNRIVMEHEERIKNQSDLKQHIDITNQITSEKHNYDREEMRERYNSMDALVRAEFERKDEAIRTLHNIIETQVRALQANIKQEELGRNQFEGYLRQEMGRYQDVVKREFEDFRQQQALTTEKLTEMIKIEIETRLGSDIELKNQMNTIAQDLSQDIELIKSHTDRSVEALSKEVRTVAADSAERANQLSRYIDQEVDSTNQNSNSKFDKLKTLFAKFGEQFKNHLLNTEAFRKESATKTMEVEQSVEFNKDEMRRQIEEIERRLDERFKEQREVVENALDNQNKVLEDKIDQIKDQKEGDFDVVKEAIENNRVMFNNKIEQLMQAQESSNIDMTELVTKMVKDVENVMKEVDEVKEDVRNVKGELGDDIADLKGYVEMELVTERTIRNQLLEDSYENLKKNINDMNSAINLLRIADDNMGKLVDGMEKTYDDRFHTFANQLSEAFLKLAGLNDNLANFEEKAKEDNLKLVGRMTADNVLLENDTKMLFKELKNVTEIVLQKNTQMKVFQERIITFLINLNKESDEIKQRVEKEILVAMDNKIMMMMEKIKKQDQEQWEKTLHHVNNGFNEAKPFISTQIPAKSKLHELVMQEDVYQDPLLKVNPQNKGQASKGAKPQENVQQANSSQTGTQRPSTPQKGNGKK